MNDIDSLVGDWIFQVGTYEFCNISVDCEKFQSTVLPLHTDLPLYPIPSEPRREVKIRAQRVRRCAVAPHKDIVNPSVRCPTLQMLIPV
jgi:hypothetical protein